MTTRTGETIHNTATDEELAAIRDSGDFPEDMDWTATYRISVRQKPGTTDAPTGDWLYALEHPYNGLQAVLTENSETIYGRTDQGYLAAYRFETDYVDQQGTISAEMFRAVETGRSQYHVVESKALAIAQIRFAMTSERSQELVSAYMETNYSRHVPTVPNDEPNALTHQGELPDDLDWDLEYIIYLKVDHEADPAYPHPNWLALITDQQGRLRDMTPPNEEICLQVFGALHSVQLAYRIDEHGGVNVAGTIHPASFNGLDWEADTGTTYAEASINVRANDPKTAAAMRQYIRRFLQ